jgi:hypothetical protein
MISPLASVSRPVLRPTQPPVQWVQGVLSPGVKCGRIVTLTTHPHMVSSSRMSRSYTSSPSWRLYGVAENLTLLLSLGLLLLLLLLLSAIAQARKQWRL